MRIEGVRAVIEAVRAGRRRVHEVHISRSQATPALRELESLLEQHRIPVRREAGGAGVVARADPFREEPFEALLEGRESRFLVALDRVTDVGNLGSIARTAEGAGVSGLLLEERHAPSIGPAALRASAGALEFLRVGRAPNLRRALDLARAEGCAVLVADARGVPLRQVNPALLRGDLVWVFGSEDRGIRPGIRDRASQLVGIPIHGRVRALGVAAAAAYLLLGTAACRAPAGPAGGPAGRFHFAAL